MGAEPQPTCSLLTRRNPLLPDLWLRMQLLFQVSHKSLAPRSGSADPAITAVRPPQRRDGSAAPFCNRPNRRASAPQSARQLNHRRQTIAGDRFSREDIRRLHLSAGVLTELRVKVTDGGATAHKNKTLVADQMKIVPLNIPAFTPPGQISLLFLLCSNSCC